MPTPKEIAGEVLDTNRLIAEFCQYEVGGPHETDKYGYHQCVDGFDIPIHINHYKHDEDRDCHQFTIEQLQFHTSWDWLMPVVDKIEAIGYSVVIKNNECQITILSNRTDIPFHYEFERRDTKLQATHAAVVQFITYYNTLKNE